jgi:VanZ like protein
VLTAVPLALVVALLAARPVARALGIDWASAFLLVLGVTAILAVTLIPRQGIPQPATSPGCLVPVVALPGPDELLSINDQSLNVALFVPLGVALGLLIGQRWFAILMVAALALPWAIESTQLALPALGRTCQSGDLTDNLLGLLIGLVVGFVVAKHRRASTPA